MKNFLIILFLSTIIGLIVWDAKFRKHSTPPSVISYSYIPDTIYIPAPYPIPEPYPVETPPRIITYYQIDSTAIDSMSLIISELDIMVMGLLDTISIHQSYLKQYPNNPKLLAVDLKRDTVSMGLLNITGIPQEEKWPIDLNQFDYIWNYVAGLTRHPTSLPPTKEKSPLEYFVGGGVDFLYLSPYVSGSIEKDWARIRLYSTAEFGLLKKEPVSIKFGVDYKFNGKNRNRNK